MTFEYKIVGAPEKGKRKRGLRSQSDRVAYAFEKLLKAETKDGWEYLRTDLLPVTERSGWFGRGHEMHRAVMVFRRSLDPAQAGSTLFRPIETAPQMHQTPALSTTPETNSPQVSEDPDLLIADSVRGPGGSKPED